MNDMLLLVICVVAACLCAMAGRQWRTPFLALYSFWAVIFLGRVLLPMGLTPTSGAAAAIVGVGLVSLAVGLLLTSPAVERRLISPNGGTLLDDGRNRAPMVAYPAPSVDHRRLLLVVGVLLTAVLIGIWQYRSVVSTQAGADFGDLTRQQILYYQIYGRPIESTPALLLLQLCPVVAVMGVVAGRRNPVGYLLIAAAVISSMQNPSRTATISAALLTLIVFLYLRSRAASETNRGVPRRFPLVILLAATLAATILYFNSEAEALKKTGDPRPGVPAELEFLSDPLTYATGSLSALSVATGTPRHVPPNTDELRSIWLVPRTLSLVDPEVPVPSPIAGFVDIPEPYNTYTMFGDLYFDFGLGGVALCSLCVGILAGLLHKRAVAMPTPLNALMSAVCILVLLSGTTGFKLLWLDTVTWLTVGMIALAWIGVKARDWPRRHSASTMDAARIRTSITATTGDAASPAPEAAGRPQL